MQNPHPPDPFYILRGTDSPVTSLLFSQTSGNWLISGCQNGVVHMWDESTRRTKYRLDAHNECSVLWLDTLDDGRLLSQGRDGVTNMWHDSGGGFSKIGALPSSSLNFCGCCLLRGESSLLVVPSEVTSQIDVFDLRSRSKTCSMLPSEQSQKHGMCMSVRQSGPSEVIVGYENGSIILWDIRSPNAVCSIKPHNESVMCMDYSMSSKKGISGSTDETICSWMIDSTRITESSQVNVANAGFAAVRIRTDDMISALAGWDGNVRIFGMKKLKPLAVLSYHKQNVRSLAFSADNILACGSDDSLISLWDVYK